MGSRFKRAARIVVLAVMSVATGAVSEPTVETRSKPANELTLRTRGELRAWGDEEPGEAREGRFRVSALRVEARYERERWLRAVLELDFGGFPPPAGTSWVPEVKDAYVRLGRRPFAVRAGHLKPPTSVIELESPWKLPLARRGPLHDALLESNTAGRRLGLEVEASFGDRELIRLDGGVYRSFRLPSATMPTFNGAARAELDLKAVKLGAFALLGGTQGRTGGFWSGGADARLELELKAVTLEGWLEGLGGTYPLSRASYGAGRGIASARLGGARAGDLFGELFVFGEGLSREEDPGLPPQWVQGGGGVGAGLWEIARGSVQGELRTDGAWAVIGRASVSLERAFGF
jgi:hypothetical protein